MIGPKFEAMADEDAFSSVKFVKIDVDEAASISEKCGISCMPTFQFYKNGEQVDEFSGADEGKLRSTVQKNL